MMRNYGSSFRKSGPYTSPGTPEYDGGIPKTWSSERVPLPTSSSSRRHISAAALIPFNSGRALPSKWDDAERWITSPVSGFGAFKNSIANQAPHHRRPKSKSGPLGPTGPDAHDEGGGARRGFMGSSPLTTGVLVPDGCLSISYGTGIGVESDSLFHGNNNNYNDINSMTRSTSVPGLSDLVSESSVPSSQDDNKLDVTKDDEDDDEEEGPISYLASWNVGEASKNISKLQREEAKINAWENLQKAKAEAAIQKLEMKLEKKRSGSMDKITNKLRAAQLRAQAMRDLLSDQAPRNSHKGVFSLGIFSLENPYGSADITFDNNDVNVGVDLLKVLPRVLLTKV
ncbi:hypothetical protein PHJA_002858400 [Phtheirospermum japonicum]|uniref:Remorin C-terminal domain-containing protein n=1 Tax=Phtheirospermum japonicum TaxID=374723 RepID=A0A830D909_9LAMI|nr:hypothetical protein PHJA_002858400 [Phtheirospermum japonicum]